MQLLSLSMLVYWSLKNGSIAVIGYFSYNVTLKYHFQQQLVSSDCLQECRNPHTNPSLRISCQNWAIPGFKWVANRECLQAGPQLFLTGNSVCGRCASTEKDKEKIEQPVKVCFSVQPFLLLTLMILSRLHSESCSHGACGGLTLCRSYNPECRQC